MADTSPLVARLSAEDLPYFPAFTCGDEDLDDFLKSDAWRLQQQNVATSYLAFYEKLGFRHNRSPEYRDRENPSLRLDVFAPELPAWI